MACHSMVDVRSGWILRELLPEPRSWQNVEREDSAVGENVKRIDVPVRLWNKGRKG